jgi:hypothetical protein
MDCRLQALTDTEQSSVNAFSRLIANFQVACQMRGAPNALVRTLPRPNRPLGKGVITRAG